jgi:hypothetical protein
MIKIFFNNLLHEKNSKIKKKTFFIFNTIQNLNLEENHDESAFYGS